MKHNMAGLIPVFCHLMLVITAPFNGFLYYFDETYTYHHGKGRFFLYICILAVIILGVIVAFQNIKRLRNSYRTIIFSYSLICCVTLFVQYYFPQIIVAGFGRACIVLLMYLSMQNMGEYKDSIANIYNSAAFPIMFAQMQMRNHQFSMITLELERYNKVAMELGNTNAMNLLRQLADKLYKIGK